MVVGLTGGIASGKSLVSNELRRLGAHIIDADVISREITEAGAPAYLDILKEFGESILKEDGTIDRKSLGCIVFSDPGKLKKLNMITHPRIKERLRKNIEEIKGKYKDGPLIVVDVALLIEAGFYKEMDKVIVVYADEDKQIERLASRDNLSRQDALRRVKAQMDLKEKIRYADYVIYNNGPVEETKDAVRELYEKLTKTG